MMKLVVLVALPPYLLEYKAHCLEP